MTAFDCPITFDMMQDPVVLIGDGHSYERDFIGQWLGAIDSQGETYAISPISRARLGTNAVIANTTLRRVIIEIKATLKQRKDGNRAASSGGGGHGNGDDHQVEGR